MSRDTAIGLFGGTFDPVHFGHLRAASEAREKLDLQHFRLLPAGQPPHRSGTWASGAHRLAMLRLAVADHPDLAVDEREVRRGGSSYMVDTLAEIRGEHPQAPLLLLLGQDAANKLDSWHRWGDLFGLAHLVVMTRPGASHDYSEALASAMQGRHTEHREALFDQPAGLVHHVEVTQLAISSTEIRDQVLSGRSPRFLLPDRILGYISYHGLYRQPPPEA